MRPSPIKSRSLADGPHDSVDVVIGGLGYEVRSRRIPEAFRDSAKRTILIDLKSPGEHSYDENRAVADAAGDEILNIPPEGLPDWLLSLVDALRAPGHTPHLAIDVSSIPRDRIARLVEGLRQIDTSGPEDESSSAAIVDVLYTPSMPPTATPGPERIEVLGPVTPAFAGFAPDPDSPVVAFVGLGIEQDRAIGALEYIEPATTWAFVPYGEDETFDRAMEEANFWVWRSVDFAQQIRYKVEDPFWLYTTLERLVFSESAAGRPILVPLGPKIFAACCLLVASHNERAGVWRVSAGRFAETRDYESAGKLVGLRLDLGRAGAFG